MVITDLDSHGDGTESTVQNVAMGLDLSMPRVKQVDSMYNNWVKRGTIQRHRGKLTDYYEDMISLSIVAHNRNDKDLSYSILLKWQEENYRHASTMPNLESVMTAFKYLPCSSSLCKWIIHFYSFLWSTETYVTYEDFCLQLGIEKRPSESFLYGVAQTRCPFTKGKDIRLLKDWCVLHNHKDELSHTLLADLIKKEEEEELEMAKMTVMKHEGNKQNTNRAQRNILKREHNEHTTLSNGSVEDLFFDKSELGRCSLRNLVPIDAPSAADDNCPPSRNDLLDYPNSAPSPSSPPSTSPLRERTRCCHSFLPTSTNTPT
ncbi:hypothetical protein K469DRAFT_683299 [Zopfia rhizophila CBS 207.26]|uniref:Uncharacterized protein n=1 Tax=Zopfia rhizophila CBS 207.26 TaxID=1314779 RepID=A0A6A6EDY9_9PEZI|nr:hypothetical protein K469DRAFT_683299 [Zopfia rhizophila CBS 207.26]